MIRPKSVNGDYHDVGRGLHLGQRSNAGEK
jgi:hypothetical protein